MRAEDLADLARDLGRGCRDEESRDRAVVDAETARLQQRLAADVPGARVVKAFNTMAAQVIALDRDELARHHVSVFLCSDDATAKAVVRGLAEELGFVGVDSGELERSQLVEALADFVRFQIAGMGLSAVATLSLHRLGDS